MDIIFKTITHLGDGFVCIFSAVILFAIRKKKKGITLALAFAYSGLLAQLLKQIFHMPRPKYFFEHTLFKYTHFVDGVKLYNHNAFPSGHTTSAFAMATVIVLVFKKKKLSFICLFTAIMVGYSRIYLAQHFLLDVITGALTGLICALISYHQVYDLKLFRIAKLSKGYKRLKIAGSSPASI